MSDVTETLQDLMERRLRDLGKRRGRGESISLREAYGRLLDKVNDHNADVAATGQGDEIHPPTYEVFRRIRNGHTKISDTTAVALATMLDVDVNEVFAAARVRPTLGKFKLPTRADRLTEEQRAVVLAVIDTILDAGELGAAATGAVAGKGRTQVHHYMGSGKTANLVLLQNRDGIASAVESEIEKLGGKVPEKLVRVAVRTALDADRHPELYEDLAARDTTE